MLYGQFKASPILYITPIPLSVYFVWSIFNSYLPDMGEWAIVKSGLHYTGV